MGKFRPAKNVPSSFKQKNRKNKKNKTEVLFNEDARDKWLSGFSKRKTERRKRAQREEIERLKEEKRRIKQEKRDERAKQLEEMRVAVGAAVETELETMAPPKVYDMSTHTVTVVDVTNTDFVGSSGLHLGFNNLGEEEEEEPQVPTSTTEGAEEENEEDEEQAPAKGGASGKKRPTGKPKRKGKKHKNLTHLMDKRKMAKRLKHKDGDDRKRSRKKMRRKGTSK